MKQAFEIVRIAALLPVFLLAIPVISLLAAYVDAVTIEEE